MFRVGEKVRTIAGSRGQDDKFHFLKIVEVGRFWREFPAVMGRRYTPADGTGSVLGKRHIYLVKNLVRN